MKKHILTWPSLWLQVFHNDRSLHCVKGASGWVRGGPPTGFRRGAGEGGGGPSIASSPCAGKSRRLAASARMVAMDASAAQSERYVSATIYQGRSEFQLTIHQPSESGLGSLEKNGSIPMTNLQAASQRHKTSERSHRGDGRRLTVFHPRSAAWSVCGTLETHPRYFPPPSFWSMVPPNQQHLGTKRLVLPRQYHNYTHPKKSTAPKSTLW